MFAPVLGVTACEVLLVLEEDVGCGGNTFFMAGSENCLSSQ